MTPRRPVHPPPPLPAPPPSSPRIIRADLAGTWRDHGEAYEARVVVVLGKLDYLVRAALKTPHHEATAAGGAVVVRVKRKKPGAGAS